MTDAKPERKNPASNAESKPAGAVPKIDFADYDLRKLDLMRKYDDDFKAADGLNWTDHLLLYAIGALLLIFIIWANLATVEETARGEGKVIPSSQVQTIQNLEGGIIDKFLVHEGDQVRDGQVILRMRNIQARADFDATMQKYLGLLATTTRLQVEADGKDSVTFPDEVQKGDPEAVRVEQEAFDADKRQNDNQESVLRDQISQKNQEVEELKRRIADTSSVLGLAVQERDMVAPMVEKGAAAKKELLEIRQKIAQQAAELDGLKLALPRAQAAAKEAQGKLDAQVSDFRAGRQKDLSEKSIELNTLKQTIAAYRDKSERTEIKSPVHGTVKDLHTTTVGGVVKPGETIMEIVPLEDQLVVEAKIKPSDIAFIHDGQKATVRLSAFDFSIYGALEGKVIEVSPDSTTTDKGESFYRVRIKTAKTQMRKGEKIFDVTPGMQGTVDIVTGDKTIMQYLLKPFKKAAREALRER